MEKHAYSTTEKTRAKIAILGTAILLMGLIGISGGLSVIKAHFPSQPDTAVQMLVALPSLAMIPFALWTGALRRRFSDRALVIAGLLCFVLGGFVPAFCTTFPPILVFRAVFGAGIGILQTLNPVLISAYFDGEERGVVMGQQAAAQMLGCIVMVSVGGYLADIGWDKVFYVHLIGLVSLALTLIFMPRTPAPVGATVPGRPPLAPPANSSFKSAINIAVIGWIAVNFAFLIGGHTFSTFIAYFVDAHGLGTAAQSGQTVAIFAAGGFVMGLLYAKFKKYTKALTLPVAFAILFASFMIMAYAGSIASVYIGSFVCGLAFGAIMPTVITAVSFAVPEAARATAFALVICAQNGAQFLSPAVVAPIASAIGGETNQNALLIGAYTAITLAIITLIQTTRSSRNP